MLSSSVLCLQLTVHVSFHWHDGVCVQEELAFVFEMLQQFEDALVQYDELDALFTQYVLNFGAGGQWAHHQYYGMLSVAVGLTDLLSPQTQRTG